MGDSETALAEHLATFDLEVLKRDFAAQDEFVKIADFLPQSVLDELLEALPSVENSVHRNYIPKHKKGGSVSRYDLDQAAPGFATLYTAPELTNFLQALCSRELKFCPADDPHTYALYFYTEPGDHIGYHYDTSYYQGVRYTALLGLVSAPSCQLEYQLHTKNADRSVEKHSIELSPGTLVLFNGDKLHHRITPLAKDQRRVSLTFEYLTNTNMHPWLRFISNMKDSIAYFGFKQVFKGGNRKKRAG
jgi:alkylated DNA repair dioxygenase AlkB